MNTMPPPIKAGQPAPMNPTRAEASRRESSLPWWRYGYLWLVLAGPMVVVVASFATLWLAVRFPDPVLATGPRVSTGQPQAGDRDAAAAAVASGQALAPALKARNHAATGTVPNQP